MNILSKKCPVCMELKGIFAHFERRDIANRAIRELMDGCKKHPAYRFKKKPTSKCKECVRLYEMHQQLIELETERKLSKTAHMRAEEVRLKLQREADEQYYNSHQ